MDCSPPHPSVHGILQAGYWSWSPFPPPGGLPDPRIEPVSCISALQADSTPLEPFGEAQIDYYNSLHAQLCSALCDSVN